MQRTCGLHVPHSSPGFQTHIHSEGAVVQGQVIWHNIRASHHISGPLHSISSKSWVPVLGNISIANNSQEHSDCLTPHPLQPLHRLGLCFALCLLATYRDIATIPEEERDRRDMWATREMFVKWKLHSHIHCSWESKKSLERLAGYKRVINYMRRVGVGCVMMRTAVIFKLASLEKSGNRLQTSSLWQGSKMFVSFCYSCGLS